MIFHDLTQEDLAMASILKFERPAALPERAAGEACAGGEVVAMKHINLDAVLETVRVIRALDKVGLLDEYNGRRHARLMAQAEKS